MAKISLQNICKIYDNNVKVVDNFNLEIEDQEFIIFVGPSGCGKSTTLRMIAGLEEISSGELKFDNQIMNGVAPKDRDISMIFQNYALYPHMSVYENMAFSLKLRKIQKNEIDKTIRNAAKILDIESLLDRKPKALSGGQKQRVAMGRAIVRNPKVFLMDEPLSNLDAKLRVQMRTEIAKLHNKLGSTIIYVTHDQIEAMTLGTRIVVMKDGIIQQIDTPEQVYKFPANLFVAGFIGSPQMNFFDARCIVKEEQVLLVVGGIEIQIPTSKGKKLVEKGYYDIDVIVGIRSEDIYLVESSQNDGSDYNIKGIVNAYELLGAEALLHCNMEGNSIILKTKPDTNVKIGSKLQFKVNAEKIHVFDKITETCITN